MSLCASRHVNQISLKTQEKYAHKNSEMNAENIFDNLAAHKRQAICAFHMNGRYTLDRIP